VAGTIELAQAEVDGDLGRFARLLDVPKPESWPPPLNDADSQRYFLAQLQGAGATDAGWSLWFCVRREPRVLVGSAGFTAPPREGCVEIGYSMLEAHQRNGYCPEAVRALLDWAFARSEVGTVIARTLSELPPSIRVLQKCGFEYTGERELADGVETIRYELSRARAAAYRGAEAHIRAALEPSERSGVIRAKRLQET